MSSPGPKPYASPSAVRVFGRAPLFVACAAFATGIVVGHFAFPQPLLLAVAFVLILGATTTLAKRRNSHAAAFGAVCLFAFVGVFSVQVREADVRPESPLVRYSDGDEVHLTGYVIRDGIWRDGAFGGKQQSVDLAVEQVSTEAGVERVPGAVRLSIYSRTKRSYSENESDEDDDEASAQPFHTLVYGERVELTAKLRPPMNYRNPGALDYVAYLHGQGIDVLGSARADTLELQPGIAGSRLGRVRSAVRRSIIARIHAIWPQRQAGLLDAMLIGERAYIGHEWRDAFQRSGTYHVLVVSGMNVGILAFAVFWLLRRLRAGEMLSTLSTLFVTCGYACIADSGPPITRAALMLAIYLVTRLLYRERAALNAVGTAALLVLAADPVVLFDASFQLTFLSVVAIGGIALPILERTSEPYAEALQMLNVIGFDQALEPKHAQFRLDLRMIIGRLRRFVGLRVSSWSVVGVCRAALSIYEVLLVSALMQVALALPMIWYFHRATLSALPANALVVPLTGFLMPSAVLAVAIGYVWLPIAKLPALLAGWSLDGITGTVRLLGGVHAKDVRLPVPSTTIAVLAAAAFVLALLLARRRPLLSTAGLAALVASAFLLVGYNAPKIPATGIFEITAIDVGQGDSLLMVSPEGKTLLLDSGGLLGNGHSEFDIGEDVVSPYLWTRGIARLDAVAFSHGHSDHMGGMAAVVRNFRPRELWMAEANVQTPELDRLLKAASENAVAVQKHTAGDQFDFGGLHFEVLSPPRDWELKDRVRDDDAMILRVSYGQNSVLLPGDAGKKIENMLVEHDIHADLLKVPHHGSTTSTSPELLAAVRPKFAVISVGRRNSFRHPRPEVLARLAEAHVTTFRTDTMGQLSFFMDGKIIRVEQILP